MIHCQLLSFNSLTMIKWLFKYGAVIFLFNTVLLAIESTKAIGDQVFLVLMAVYAIALLINPQQIKNVLFHKAFSFLLILNLLNVFYFLIFHSINDIKAIKYLLARGIQFSIISVAIFFNYEYYKTKFLDHLVYVIVFIVFVGLLFNADLFSGRYGGLIWNSNMLASFTSLAFTILFLKQKQHTRFEVFLLLLLFVISISTGSRGVLLAIALAFLFKYGFSKRNIFYSFLALSVYFLVVNIQLDTSINRFASQSLFNDRLLQYQYAYETIFKQPFFGFGLDKYAYIDPSVIPYSLRGYNISAHNGYLAILTQYGLIFGSIILFIIFRKTVQVSTWFKQSFETERAYLFIIISALFVSVYETMITGINEFHTILFWFGLAFLSYTKFTTDHEN